MTTETPELAPCPFCGGEATRRESALSENGDTWFVECSICEASGPGGSSDKDEVVANWNRRASAEPAVAVKALETDILREFSSDELAEALEWRLAQRPSESTALASPSPSPVVSEEDMVQRALDEADYDNLEWMRAAIALAPAPAGWRTDIADAPRDGTPVRLLIETEAKWQQHLPMVLQQGGWQRTAHSDKVLGWQPLPTGAA